METLIASVALWNQVFIQNPKIVAPPPTEVQHSLGFRAKNPAYFPSTLSAKEKNKRFYEKLAFPATSLQSSSFSVPTQKVTSPEEAIVIIAPHPDDEVLCCGKKIEESIQNKKNVKIIFLTNGDALANATFQKAQEYGRWRKVESTRAAIRMGLREEDLCFFGFPDGTLASIEQGKNVRSQYTDWSTSPHDACFAGTMYTKTALKKNLAALLTKFSPTEIYIPSERLDDHPDHRIAAQWTKEVLSELNISPAVFEYVVHGKKVLSEERLYTPDTRKLQLIRVFRSQFWDAWHKEFMEQFAVMPEKFTRVIEQLAHTDLR